MTSTKFKFVLASIFAILLAVSCRQINNDAPERIPGHSYRTIWSYPMPEGIPSNHDTRVNPEISACVDATTGIQASKQLCEHLSATPRSKWVCKNSVILEDDCYFWSVGYSFTKEYASVTDEEPQGTPNFLSSIYDVDQLSNGKYYYLVAALSQDTLFDDELVYLEEPPVVEEGEEAPPSRTCQYIGAVHMIVCKRATKSELVYAVSHLNQRISEGFVLNLGTVGGYLNIMISVDGSDEISTVDTQSGAASVKIQRPPHGAPVAINARLVGVNEGYENEPFDHSQPFTANPTHPGNCIWYAGSQMYCEINYDDLYNMQLQPQDNELFTPNFIQ